MNRQRAALTVFLLTPFLLLGVILLGIKYSRPAMDAPPVGAGATSTGGANAIGEYLAHGSAKPVVATGTLRRLEVQGGAGVAPGTVRELIVWLPPGYDDRANGTRKYPVLYLHDGQNLFEGPDGAPTRWRADQTASDLISKGLIRPMIIVGVPHSGAGRISEYLPVPALEGVTPLGSVHVRWLTSEVMPKVEQAFRIRTGPENTGIGGSSLGAAVSVQAVSEHPELFGLLLAESLPLRTGNAAAWDQLIAGVKTWPGRVFLGIGGQELGPEPDKSDRNKAYLQAVQDLDARLGLAGLGLDRRLLVVDPTATHNEDAWAGRLPRALGFLFPPETGGGNSPGATQR